MQTARIAIVGGGLSGLYAAYLLQQKGIKSFVLFEARENHGGRIRSVATNGAMASTRATSGRRDRFDLGPTWFWPAMQPQLDAVVRELGIGPFEQYEIGDMLVERSYNDTPRRTRGFMNSPKSMRLVGGMAALTDALASKLDPNRLHVAEAVRELRRVKSTVEVHSVDVTGKVRETSVEHVLLALPPRLAEASLCFSPTLPDVVRRQWRDTPTWMAPHAKYIATYPTAFWREHGLSGEARSMAGPLGEIHDASMPGGSAALFGFLGFPANIRMTVKEDALRAHCRAQLVRLFGAEASTPESEFIKDWARDPYTCTANDLDGFSGHAASASCNVPDGPWKEHLTGIASEYSEQFPGYLAGAIEAAHRGVSRLLAERSIASNLPY